MILNAHHVYQPSSTRTYAKRALKSIGILLIVRQMTTAGITKLSSTSTSEINVTGTGSKQGKGLEGCTTPLSGNVNGKNQILVRWPMHQLLRQKLYQHPFRGSAAGRKDLSFSCPGAMLSLMVVIAMVRKTILLTVLHEHWRSMACQGRKTVWSALKGLGKCFLDAGISWPALHVWRSLHTVAYARHQSRIPARFQSLIVDMHMACTQVFHLVRTTVTASRVAVEWRQLSVHLTPTVSEWGHRLHAALGPCFARLCRAQRRLRAFARTSQRVKKMTWTF